MKSVEALRKWADGLRGIWLDPNDHSIIVTTCDDMPPSIDCVNLREHVNEILDGIDREVEERYTALPVDADGVPIRAGDVMEELSGHTFEVASLMAFGGSDNWLVLSDPRNFSSFREPHDLRHHHAPTVEDVLREFLDNFHDASCIEVEADVVAEYAAKLRLAGDE